MVSLLGWVFGRVAEEEQEDIVSLHTRSSSQEEMNLKDLDSEDFLITSNEEISHTADLEDKDCEIEDKSPDLQPEEIGEGESIPCITSFPPSSSYALARLTIRNLEEMVEAQSTQATLRQHLAPLTYQEQANLMILGEASFTDLPK